MANQQQQHLTPIAKWLFGGPGFAVVVLVLSTTVGFQVLNYSSTQQERRKLLMGRVAALTAIRAETLTNIERADFNAEGLEKAARQRGTYPGLMPYAVTVWNAVAASEGIITLSPEKFVDLSLSYGRLVDANRDFSILQEYNLVSPLQVRSVSPEEYGAQDRNRASVLRSMHVEARSIQGFVLPLMENRVSEELESAKKELAAVENNVEQFRRTSTKVATGAAVILGIVAALAFLEIIFVIGSAIYKNVRSAKTSESGK